MTEGNGSNDSIDNQRQTSRRRVLAGTATLAVAGIAGCTGGDDGDGTATGTGTGTAQPTETETPLTPSSCEPESIESNITEDTTWTASECPRYALESNIAVTDGATLTIEPGVEVVASEATDIHVQTGGTLVASGEADNPIWFYGESAVEGYWRGLEFNSNTTNELDNVIVSHGGSDDGWANIDVTDGSRLSVTNTVSEQSGTQGLYAGVGATLSSFSNNEFRNNGGPAIEISTNQIGSLEGNSTFVGENAEDVIKVFYVNVDEDATWPATDAPYLFDQSWHQIVDAAVTVEAGAELQFSQGASLEVQSGTGSLTAEGDDDNQILFRGAVESQGYWGGLEINSDNPDNTFDNVEIAHGGSSEDRANIYVDGGNVSVSNSTLRDSGTWGLYADDNSTLSYSNVTTQNNISGGIREPGDDT